MTIKETIIIGLCLGCLIFFVYLIACFVTLSWIVLPSYIIRLYGVMILFGMIIVYLNNLKNKPKH